MKPTSIRNLDLSIPETLPRILKCLSINIKATSIYVAVSMCQIFEHFNNCNFNTF